jgi:hypothetical protein
MASLATWKATSQLPVEWQCSVYSDIKWRVTTRVCQYFAQENSAVSSVSITSRHISAFLLEVGKNALCIVRRCICTKIHWLICFYYTNQMHMAHWIQPREHKDTPVVSYYIEIKLYVMFHTPKFFVWTLYSNISSFLWLFALVEPLLLDRTFGLRGMHSLNSG